MQKRLRWQVTSLYRVGCRWSGWTPYYLAHVFSWNIIANIDHWNNLQTSKAMWYGLYKKCIGSLCIVVWHIRVSAHLVQVTWLEFGLNTNYFFHQNHTILIILYSIMCIYGMRPTNTPSSLCTNLFGQMWKSHYLFFRK